jgi:tetratricopeptide (TPR) repeat protein
MLNINYTGKLTFWLIPIILTLSACNSNPKENVVKPTSSTDLAGEIAEISNKLASDSLNAGLFNKRAILYIKAEKLNNALNDVNKAMALDTKMPAAYITLSDIYLLQGKPGNALDALRKSIGIDENYTESYIRLARLYLIMKDYPKTTENINKALNLEPGNAQAYFLKGFVLEENGDTTRAIESYQRAVSLNQQYYEAYIQLGSLYSIQNSSLAAGYFNSALNIKPDSKEVLYMLGMLYQENDQPDQALGIYKRMIALDSTDKIAYYNSGYVKLVYLKKFKEASGLFSKAVQLDPQYADACFNRGYCYELMGEISKARADYEKVMKINPNDPKAIEGLNRLDKIIP